MTRPLHDPIRERDACGIGLVADARGRASRELLDRALAGLAAVAHRGAWAADGVTGDGAGLLLPLHPCLTGVEGAGIAMCFLREPWLRGVVEDACRAEGLEPAGWREVPHDSNALGSTAAASMPRIVQLVLAPCEDDDAEVRAYRARRRAELVEGVYVASLSFRSVTYKALCAATQLASFYPDLRDPEWKGSWAIFHQRFSTNTHPSWERAQPFRLLCHNGEINTIDGNVAWLEARERAAGLDPALSPALDATGSDSALLDNAAELLVRSGLDVREALSRLVPPAWQNDPRTDEAERAMRRYHAMLAEPWDGPAGLVFSDGRVCGAKLDRNGLRPLRIAVCSDGLVTVASEAGAVPLPEGVTVRRARLAPGQLFSVDPERGVLFDGELTRELASRRPYAQWVSESLRFGEQGAPAPMPDDDLTARHALHGYTREDMSLMLRPIAQTGKDPVYSMGDDAPIAPLAGRARPLASYFRQRFAQVTNPAIDHERERAVMTVATLVGPRSSLDAEGVLPGLVALPSFLVTPDGLAALDPVEVDATFDAAEGLSGAVDRVADACAATAEGGVTVVCLTDRGAGSGRAPIPSLLAVAATHERLIERGVRTACSLVVSSDETRDTHMVAALLGYGADVICPHLALETVARLAATDKIGGDRPTPDVAQARLLGALELGVLKVMSKAGISDVASYRGARLFEAVGLDRRLCRRFFGATASAIGGIGLERLERDALERLAASEAEKLALENPGFYKFRKGGEPHATDPGRRGGAPGERHCRTRADQGRPRRAPRCVRPVRRAGRAATAARAARPPRARPAAPDPGRRRRARRVDRAAVLGRSDVARGPVGGGARDDRNRDEPARRPLELGRGRRGPGALRRRAQLEDQADRVGSVRRHGRVCGLCRRAPDQGRAGLQARRGRSDPRAQGDGGDRTAARHDARRGADLATAAPRRLLDRGSRAARVRPEGGQPGGRRVGQAGLLGRRRRDRSGRGEGARGHRPRRGRRRRHGREPAPLDQARRRPVGARPGRDPAGTRRQRATRPGARARRRRLQDRPRRRGRGASRRGRVLVRHRAPARRGMPDGALLPSRHLPCRDREPEARAPGEVRGHARDGRGIPPLRRPRGAPPARRPRPPHARRGGRPHRPPAPEAHRRPVGRRDRPAAAARPLRARPARYVGDVVPDERDRLGALLHAQGKAAISGARLVEPAFEITNADRAVGARLGGAIARSVGAGRPAGRVRARFEGAAGQSFGAFLTDGVELVLVGEANDYVGKAMSGGRIAVSPPPGDAGDPCLVGNTALYGATGGALFCAGAAGERFGVRNSGAVAVIEGVGDHACEYMTRGTVVVLGAHGRNLGAGMTGGEAFLLDPDERLVNHELVALAPLDRRDGDRLAALLERHVRATGSERAARLVADLDQFLPQFRRLVPRTELAASEPESGHLEARSA